MLSGKNVGMRKYISTALVLLLNTMCARDCVAEGLRDIKGPVAFPPNFFLLYGIPAVTILVLGFVLLRRLIKNARQMSQTKPKSEWPWVIAYRRLDALQQKNLSRSGNVKEYYTELSDITRRYIEDRFHIKAPDMTTEEFLHSLKGSRDLSADQQQLLEGFLNSCDMVKFAKYGPPVTEMEQSFSLARKLVDETKKDEQESPS